MVSIAAMLCTFIFKYRLAEDEMGSRKKHITFIENV